MRTAALPWAKVLAQACILAVLARVDLAEPRAEERSATRIEGVPEPATPGIDPSLVPPVDGPIEKARNEAGLSVEVLPGLDVSLGARIAFRVTTRKPGYLLLIDIDASGKLTQIYPNIVSLTQAAGNLAEANLIRPGKPVAIPDLRNPFARFEFVAEPPIGTGTVVAILGNRPVQVIDLPDVPSRFMGQDAAVDYLYSIARTLKIAAADTPGTFADGDWSFDAKTYRIH